MNILQQIELDYLEILESLDITELGLDKFILTSEEEFSLVNCKIKCKR